MRDFCKYGFLKISVLSLFLFFSPLVLHAESAQKVCNELIQSGLDELFYKKKHSKALGYLSEAQVLAKTNKWNKELFLATNGIGIVYSELSDYNTALDYFLEAYNISSNGLEKHYELTAMLNIGIMYYKTKDADKALKYLQEVYNQARQEKDKGLIGISATNIAIIYNKTNKPKLAEKYIHEAMNLLKNDNRGLPYIMVAKAENAFLSNNLEESEMLANEILLNTKGKEKDKEHRANAFLLLSKIYEKKNRYPLSLEYAGFALQENTDMNNKIELYNLLSSLHFKTNHFEKAIFYKDSVILAKDSLNKLINQQRFENNKIKFEMENYQKNVEYSKARITRDRIIFILIVVITGLIFVWIIHYMASKNKQKKIIADRNQKIVTLELEREINNKKKLEKQLELNKEQASIEQMNFDNELEALKSEIEIKNRKLVTRAVHLLNKNNLINNVYSAAKDLPESTKKRILISHVNKLCEQFESESDWKNYLLYFEEINKDFITALQEKHPDLTANDIRFLSYIYIGLNTKEISVLLNITVDSCKKKKLRVSKKLNLQSGPRSLYSYLSAL